MRFIAGIVVSALVFAASTARAQAPVTDAPDDAGPVVAAMFYSGWCGVCRLLEPKVNAMVHDYDEAPIEFVKFDFTWGKKQHHADLAADLGILPHYEKFKRGQGYIVFIDPDSGSVLDIVTGLDSRTKIRAAFDRAAEFGA